MSCPEVPPCLMTQIQNAICQICGHDMSSTGSKEPKKNYQKKVDPPRPAYKQVIPDARYDEIEARAADKKKGKDQSSQQDANPCVLPFQICLMKSDGTFPALPAIPETGADTKSGAAKERIFPASSAAMKSACMPVGGSGGGSCPPPIKMLLCLPCPQDNKGGGQSRGGAGGAGCTERHHKPRDYTYRCESRELRAGNLYTCCQCIKRNGLQHDCPRTPCQGRPACLAKPWPDCWPSGGCHGIDFSRENGVSRYNPCSEQRMDKKDCRPPGAPSAPRADCGGNMMVVLCQPPNLQK